jgi:hypothetical protein
MFMYLISTQITGKKFKQVIINLDQDVDTQQISLRDNFMYLEGMIANFPFTTFGCYI